MNRIEIYFKGASKTKRKKKTHEEIEFHNSIQDWGVFITVYQLQKSAWKNAWKGEGGFELCTDNFSLSTLHFCKYLWLTRVDFESLFYCIVMSHIGKMGYLFFENMVQILYSNRYCVWFWGSLQFLKKFIGNYKICFFLRFPSCYHCCSDWTIQSCPQKEIVFSMLYQSSQKQRRKLWVFRM